MAVVTGDTGNHGDSVIRCGVQDAPIVASDLLDRLHLIGASAFGGGVGHLVPHIHILDGADDVLRAAVVSAQAHIAIPDTGGGEVAEAFVHAGVCGPFPEVIVFDADSGDGDFANGPIRQQKIIRQMGVGRQAGQEGFPSEIPGRVTAAPPPLIP